jgi:hypothetical protein
MLISRVALTTLFFMPVSGHAHDKKSYKHAAQYQLATLDKSFRVATGNDVTLGKSQTDAKLDSGGQGMHMLYTEQGNFRVEAPVNKGRSFGNAFATAMANSNRPAWAQQQAATIHNKWFLDNVESGTKVLFATQCTKPNKKHPNDTVRCTFWFPDPDSADHEYETLGDFTPYITGDGSNTQATANTLCGTGKLKPDVEAQLCGTAPATVATAAPATVAAAAQPK